MPRFIVKTHLACWQAWLVEADSPDDAIARYPDGELVAEHVPEELPADSPEQFELFSQSAG